MIEFLAYVFAILVILTLLLFIVGIIAVPSIILVEKTENNLWWLLVFATAPGACLSLIGLIRLIAVMGG